MAYSTVAQNIVVSFTPSDHNGYHISCFGKQDGAINTSVTGGVPPYTYAWSNQAQGPNLTGLASGYYRLVVSDANNARGEAEITLIEPAPLTVSSSISMYPNGFNISCYDCYNGSITITAANGISPYSYSWADGPVTQNRNVLGAGIYHVTVTDANACTKISEPLILGQPDRGDWTMEGNVGTDPNVNFIGTTDAKDVVFKSNNTEQLRLMENGDVRLNGSLNEVGFLLRDANGTLRTHHNFPPYDPGPSLCIELGTFFPFWKVTGNNFSLLCPGELPILGTLSATPLSVVTNGLNRIYVQEDGKTIIGNGTLLAEDQFEVHTDLDRGGITLVNIAGGPNAHTEIRFKKGTALRWALGCDFGANGGQDFFIWNSIQNNRPFLIDTYGRVGIGHSVENSMGSNLNYLLYVDGSIACRELKVQVGLFPDYVFHNDYQLLSFEQLRDFIKNNGHLPGIPSEADVIKNEGVELGDLQVKMLKVIEEQTLYILQLEERLNKLEAAR